LTSRAQTDGDTRLAEMNGTVDTNLLTIIILECGHRYSCPMKLVNLSRELLRRQRDRPELLRPEKKGLSSRESPTCRTVDPAAHRRTP